MQGLVKPFTRGFLMRTDAIHLFSPNRKILDNYRYQKVNFKKANTQLEGICDAMP